MKLKVGDKVKLNMYAVAFRYGQACVSYKEIGQITDITKDGDLIIDFPSFESWRGLEDELILVSKGKHFKSLPNDYTGTIEVKNGFVQEKEILDEAEKRYLKAIIKPFKNKINHISKEKCYDGNCYISIELGNYESINLPYFKKETMYNGMEDDKKYTLKELKLDE